MKFFFNRNISKLNIVYTLLIAGSIVCISLLASVPPVSRDALTHHLFIPKLYLQHGGMHEIPYIPFSYYPMNIEMLYLIPLYFSNDILPKFIHFSFALATSAMIYRYLVRRINTEYALLGVLFFLTIPVIVRLSSTVYVDLGLICFLFAALVNLFEWIESEFKPKYLILSAVWCGFALGTKYNGLIGLFLLGLFVCFIYARYHTNQKSYVIKAIGCCAAFIVTTAIVYSPWAIRNITWTGNPVYPLYNSYFDTKATSVDTRQDSKLEEDINFSHIRILREIHGESWIQVALIPLRVFFQGEDDNPKYFDGRTNPFLLILPAFAFFGFQSEIRQKKAEKLLMLFFSLFFLLYACVQTSIRVRYFSAILPPLVLLSMFGLHNIQTKILNRFPLIPALLKKILIFGIIGFMLGLNTIYLANRIRKDHPLDFLFGKVTRDEYIQAFRPEFAAYQYANKHLDCNSKILGIYIGNRGYYSDRHVEFSIEILQTLAANTESGSQIAERLRERGFTHLLVNFQPFNDRIQKYSLHERKILKQFFEFYTILEFSKAGHGIFRLKEKPPP
jgi:hypothetical protein